MADWTTLPDATFEPGAPAKGRDMRFLRDNPIAIAEGAPGAPRIDGTQSPAIRNGGIPNGEIGSEKFQSGTDERDWVLARAATASVGAVGTYALMRATFGGGGVDTGGINSASTLEYASLGDGGTVSGGGAPSGSWRNMGNRVNTSDRVSVWLRVS